MEKYHFTETERLQLEKLSVPLAVYQFIDKRVVTLILSDGFCELFGFDDRQKAYYCMDYNMYRDAHPDDSARIADAAFRFATEGGNYEVIYRTKKNNESGYTIIHAMGKHVFTDTGVRLAYIWYTDEGTYAENEDMKSGKLNHIFNNALHEESIMEANNYDHMTGLPSMSYFFELAEVGRNIIISEGNQPALIFFNLCGMKFFNHKYGFAEGDKLLKAFARLLSETFSNENCSRFGSDHFVVYTKIEDLEETIECLFKKNKYINYGNSLPVHIGIYPDSMGKVSPSIACDRAKYACDSLKSVYASCYKFFDEELRERAEHKQYILENLDNAIKNGWIQIYYQPIVRAVNGRVCDEEALSRWIDPVNGFMSPAEFIPVLEEAGMIYKLDLYVLDQVLEKIKGHKAEGLFVVPQSINLSRSDFAACDIVEEIRKRVDKAGVGRDKITIEITESIIGNDFDFIKEQVERFRNLGFSVWMDDFGSGYSSLDVLQSIRFDLIKLDMSFMKRLDEGDSGKIIITEIVKMATALGVGTVCEGVETEEQVHFLQEIGCSKLQGYYFAKPTPIEEVIMKYRTGKQIGYENPEESEYFDAIGQVSLYDLTVIANENMGNLRNFFDTIPMGIMEIRGEQVRIIRSNKSYRDFMKRFFGFDINEKPGVFVNPLIGPGGSFMSLVKQNCQKQNRVFLDEKLPDGMVVHSFARKIGENPVTETLAIAIAVLSITDESEGATYESIARALATDYYNIYYVDLETDDFVEYSSPVGGDEMSVERHGRDFFGSSLQDAHRIFAEDRDVFFKAFTKENVIKELDEHNFFTATYRLMDTGNPMYVAMKAVRSQLDAKHIVIGISIIDSHVRQKETLEKIKREQVAYARIMALSGNYLSLYTVDPETDRYIEYSTTEDYETLGFSKEGEKFFVQSLIDGEKTLCPEDYNLFCKWFNKENVMKTIEEKGIFTLRYTLMIGKTPTPVCLRAALVKEADGDKLIVGVKLTDERDNLS